MKNIQISIVGEQPGGAIQGLRVPPPFDRLVLLHGDSSSSRDAASKVKEVAGAMVASKEIELIQVDPFGMNDVLNNVTKVRIYDTDATITVNLSGGTNIMASAALLGCFIIGADAFYIKFKKGEVEGPLEDRLVRLSIPRVQLDDVKGSKLEILQVLVGHKDAALTQPVAESHLAPPEFASTAVVNGSIDFDLDCTHCATERIELVVRVVGAVAAESGRFLSL